MKSVRLKNDPQLQRAESSNPLLIEGATGSGVAVLQDLLADLGFHFVKTFAHHRADGIFGPETLAAIKQFQINAGLKPDGIVGPLTLAALDDAIAQNDRLERRTGPFKAGSGSW